MKKFAHYVKAAVIHAAAVAGFMVSMPAHADVAAYDRCAAPYDEKIRELGWKMAGSQLSFQVWDTVKYANESNGLVAERAAQCNSLLTPQERAEKFSRAIEQMKADRADRRPK